MLITIDCLRGDFVNEENTPNLLKLVDKYNGFITTKAYTAGMATPHAFRAILGGTYPLKYGPKIGAPEEAPTIAEVLKKTGYRTIGFSAGNPYTSSLAGYERGFDIFEDYISLENKESFKNSRYKSFVRRVIGKRLYSNLSKMKKNIVLFRHGNTLPYLMAQNILAHAEKAIEKETSPFFLWVHLMDVHEPYLPEKNFLSFYDRFMQVKKDRLIQEVANNIIKYLDQNLSKFSEKNVSKVVEITNPISKFADHVKKIYTSSIKSIDFRITQFFKMLLESKPNTYFLVTSDHGQGLLEYGVHGHYQLFHNDTLVKIPLILFGGEANNLPIDSKSTVSNLDVGPTICDLANIEQPYQWDGLSLLKNEESNRVVFTQSIFPNILSGVLFKGVIKHFSGFLTSAHNNFKGSTSVLDNKRCEIYGSYSSKHLEPEAIKFANQTMKRFSLSKKTEMKFRKTI